VGNIQKTTSKNSILATLPLRSPPFIMIFKVVDIFENKKVVAAVGLSKRVITIPNLRE